MSNIDKEYYEYLNKLDKEELITKVMNLESQNNELSNENYELGRENVKLKSGELVSPEVVKQSFEMRDKALKKLETRIAELEDAIKVKDMLIERLENQNDRLIAQRDTQEQQLAIYKRALQLACDSIRDMYCSDYCVFTRDERCNGKCYYEKYYNKEQFLDQAKKELERKNDNT